MVQSIQDIIEAAGLANYIIYGIKFNSAKVQMVTVFLLIVSYFGGHPGT